MSAALANMSLEDLSGLQKSFCATEGSLGDQVLEQMINYNIYKKYYEKIVNKNKGLRFNDSLYKIKEQIEDVIGLDASEALLISAKTGMGVPDVLEAIVTKMPPPKGDASAPLKALLVDSWYDAYLGVMTLVRVYEGTLKKGMRIRLMQEEEIHQADQVGVFTPKPTKVEALGPGDVGYMTAAIKTVAETSVGGWRLLLLGISGGGAVLAAVLAVLWFKVLTRPEKEVARGSKAKAGAKEAGEGEGEVAGADGHEGKTKKQKQKKGGIKGAFKAVKAFATHPAVAAWRSTLGGVLDLLTDVVFAFSLWRAAENAQQRALGAAAEAEQAEELHHAERAQRRAALVVRRRRPPLAAAELAADDDLEGEDGEDIMQSMRMQAMGVCATSDRHTHEQSKVKPDYHHGSKSNDGLKNRSVRGEEID